MRTEGSRAPHASRISMYVGEVRASRAPLALHTLLGSCVAVCLFDPAITAGGMNHILLPAGRGENENARYGLHAMESLLTKLGKLGGDRRRYLAKAFGGAHVLGGANLPIGDRNAAFVRAFLEAERIPLVAERLGGMLPVRICFETHTGRVRVRDVIYTKAETILDAEARYSKRVLRQTSRNNIPLL